MTEIPRLNGVVAALEAGRPTFTTFTTADIQAAISLSATRYDGIVFEMEHNPWDIGALRDSLQYMLSRAQIASSGSVAPSVTPMVRIPPNGGEMAQWHAKQALDLGVYGVVWPHVSSVDQAYNAVAACRYPEAGLRAALRAGGHPRRRPAPCGSVLGPVPAGLLQEGGCLAARAGRRDLRHPDDRGTRRASRASPTCSTTCRASAPY